MTRSVKATKKIIEVGKKHVLDQRLRIERHKELTAELERDGQPDVVAKARQLLAEMEQTLARMQAEYATAQERLAQATADEPTVAKVERDTPM
jgi:outer membrane protein TolC